MVKNLAFNIFFFYSDWGWNLPGVPPNFYHFAWMHSPWIQAESVGEGKVLSLLVVKLLFLSAIDDVVTILFMYSYFITICSMARVTLVPNSPLNGWERDGDQIVEGLKGHQPCSALMSECHLWVSLFNLTRWDGVHLEDKADIILVYGWNQYCHVFCGWYSINPVLMSKIRYCCGLRWRVWILRPTLRF